MSVQPPAKILRIFPPPGGFGNMPENPMFGLARDPRTMLKEDFRYYCDSCQKGFISTAQYNQHMEGHIWCEHPGCKFTCRKDREWKMEMHVSTLHNRPDAPNLVDTKSYLEARKRRFPTTDLVHKKVEEWYYRAAKGELLPSERRRWLRQHGVVTRRQPRPRVPRPEEGEQGEAPAPEGQGQAPASEAGDANRGRDRQVQVVNRIKRIPGQRLTKHEQVQLVREKYAGSRNVPSFYICNRCGKKGHWVEDCPTIGDSSFDISLKWGEAKRERPTSSNASLVAASDIDRDSMRSEGSESKNSSRSSSTHSSQEDSCGGDSRAPSEVSARMPPEGIAMATEGNFVVPPSEGTPSECGGASNMGRGRGLSIEERYPNRGRGNTAGRGRRPVSRQQAYTPPTLYDKLVESERIGDRGLLLQAFRFITANNYLQPEETLSPEDLQEPEGEYGAVPQGTVHVRR